MLWPTTYQTIQWTRNAPNMFHNRAWTLIWKREPNKVLLIPDSCILSQYDFRQLIPDNKFQHLWAEPRSILFVIINSVVSDRKPAA